MTHPISGTVIVQRWMLYVTVGALILSGAGQVLPWAFGLSGSDREAAFRTAALTQGMAEIRTALDALREKIAGVPTEIATLKEWRLSHDARDSEEHRKRDTAMDALSARVSVIERQVGVLSGTLNQQLRPGAQR